MESRPLTHNIASGWCGVHGSYYGSSCPTCISCHHIHYYPQTVTRSPVSTEDAIAAMVKAFDQLINDLRDQVAERDRQLQEAQIEIQRLSVDA